MHIENENYKKYLEDLRSKLSDQKIRLGIIGLKTGTEAEEMDFPEIQFFRDLSAGILPLSVKIGGPEARIDIRKLLKMTVDGIIAPLIESPYALQKFIQTRNAIDKQLEHEQLAETQPTNEQQENEKDHQRNQRLPTWNGINIESKNGFQYLDAICQTQEFDQISQVTAARTDFSQSIGVDTDHPHVMKFCEQILRKAKQCGKRTVVGGGIRPNIISSLIKQIQPDCVSTRNLILDAVVLQESSGKGQNQITAALAFEIEIYTAMTQVFPEKQIGYQQRMHTLQTRM